MSIKGFQGIKGAIKTLFGSVEKTTRMFHATLSVMGTGKAALDTTAKQLALLSTGHQLDAGGYVEPGKTTASKRILKDTGHSLSAGKVIRFLSTAQNPYVEVSVEEVIDANHVLLSHELENVPSNDDYSICIYISPTVDLSGNINIVEGITTIVDNLDAPSLVPTGANLIPRLSNNALLVVASLAANVTRIQSVSDVGEFMNLYLDAARTQFLCHVPLTPDEVVDIDIPSGSAIYLGASKDVDIDDANSIIQMNFIG